MRHLLPLLLLTLFCAGCPQDDAPAADEAAALQPTASLPQADPLLKYGDLRLGMSNLDVAQAYNAPDGQGKGFTRGVEEYGDARNHVIQFAHHDGRPDRRVVLRLYQDKLAKLVDRRDGLTAKQADAWRAELVKAYGKPARESLPGAQWVWGDGDLTLTFTQDNQAAAGMSANVVLVHAPSYDASVRYLEWREKHGGNG